LPELEINSDELKLINKYLKKLEEEQYNLVFQKKIDFLNAAEINDKSLATSEDLKLWAKSTNCNLCKIKCNEAINAFLEKYEAYQVKLALADNEKIKSETKDQLFFLLQKEACITKHLKEDYPEGQPAHIQLINSDFLNLCSVRAELQKTLEIDVKTSNLEKIKEQNEFIRTMRKKLTEGLSNICLKVNSLCECK
jgi:hypothetical protein